MQPTKATPHHWHIRGLSVTYRGREQPVRAVRHVNITLHAGEIMAIIGESGSGKTTLARAILGALPASAHVVYERLHMPPRIAFVQQEAAASLHPLLRIGEQIIDVLMARQKETGAAISRRTAKARTHAIMQQLGLNPVTEYYHRFPHQLSGGQAQRACLARALAVNAQVLVADEPTSHLDLVTQAEAVQLIHRLTREHRIATMFITHRLPLVAEIADNVAVLHAGKIVETGAVADVWANPQHDYTKRLLDELRKARWTTERLARRQRATTLTESEENVRV